MAILPEGFTLPPPPYLALLAVAGALVARAAVRRRPAVTTDRILALAPWMVLGSALHVLYVAGSLPSLLRPLAGTPAVYVTVDAPPSHLAAHADAAAVCLATTGAGHVTERLVDPLTDLRAAGVPVIATTRCPEGRLARSTYGYRGSERTLQEAGCLISDLNLQKTRIRAMVAHAAGRLDEAFDGG